ncbi:MAG: ribbon-helix-helix protein, CopG family [Myxococcota bacterium]
MARTSVHLPRGIVEQLDRLAVERGTSRNRVILQACQELLARNQRDWPRDFFETTLRREELQELRSGGQEMEAAIVAARHDLRREEPALDRLKASIPETS